MGKSNFDGWKYTDWRRYEVKFRPDIWYNSYDGIQIGLHTNGGYMRHHHLFDATIWMSTGKLQKENIDNSDLYNKFSSLNTQQNLL